MKRRKVWHVRLLIILITFVVIFPFLLIVLNSFKVGQSIYNS